MDRRLLPPESTLLRLQPGQTVLSPARAGTWLQVRRGVLVVQPVPRWVDGAWVAPARRLAAGAGVSIDADGWWRLVVEAGPVELHCVRTVESVPRRFVARVGEALREITRRRVPS